MRLRSLVLWDIRFQARYGFYFLYAVLTAIYVAVLSAVPEGWREKAAAILIFSDPASMGLFFMGAIVLLEKSQRTPWALAVSPVRAAEYIAAKVMSLSAISLVAAAVLTAAAGVGAGVGAGVNAGDYGGVGAVAYGIADSCMVLLGTVLSSAVFTLLGIIIATRISSLNQFILWTVPVELVCFVPAILHLFRVGSPLADGMSANPRGPVQICMQTYTQTCTPGSSSAADAAAWLRYYPASVCMEMVSGQIPSSIGILMVMALIGVLFVAARYCVLNMWGRMGGGKL